jgi:DNA topoisomerase II
MKKVEDIYKKYSQIEHVLARPGMYIGEISTITSEQWVLNKDKTQIKNEFVKWNPGIYKVFDEIITNSSDESQRNKNVKNIKVTINIEENSICVFNDGSGIPIEIHKEHNVYVPELIFANLLSSSNYDDTQQRTTGGLNGLGAKLTNIYSTEFIIETVSNGQKYTQKFKDNLSVIEKPTIEKIKNTIKNYTQITFKPDLKKFGLSSLNNDQNLLVLEKRLYDISAITPKHVVIYYNDEKIKYKD